MAVKVTTLSSGLRIASDSMEGLETSSVGVWVNAGARYETLEANGISHMLEHMAFKGTERRTPRAIAEEIEAVGGHLNAYTSREQTAYFARVLADDLPLAVDLLGDILLHSTFDEEELARERAVVIQEIGQATDTPDDQVFDFLQEVAYPNQPMGRTVLGSPERVAGFGRADLIGYMGHHYRQPRMVVAAAGNVEHTALVQMAEDAFGNLATEDESHHDPALYGGGEFRENRDLEQVHLTMAFPSVPFDHPDFYAVQVFSTVLGGGMSSRLFQEVREKRGLAYSVFSFAQSYLDTGTFGIYAGTGEGEVAELAAVVGEEMRKASIDITDEETARARAQHKAGVLMGLESSAARCEQMARQLLIFDRTIPPSELIAKVDAVDAASLRRIASETLAAGPLSLAALGPLGNLETYDALAARFD